MLVNEVKVQRAIKQLKDESRARGEEMSKFVPDPAKVRELYLRFGGLEVADAPLGEETPKDVKVHARKVSAVKE